MPEITGLKAVPMFSEKTQIVFCTAYAHYAQQGFDLDVTDYLLKPVSLERFLKSCRKVALKKQSYTRPAQKFFRVDGAWKSLELADIQYVQAKGNYVLLHTPQKPVLVRTTLAQLEQDLGQAFVRIHKGYLVNKDVITRFGNREIEIGSLKLPVGQHYEKAFLYAMGVVENSLPTASQGE